MEQILELERRITAALDRLAFGLERQAASAVPVADPAQIAQLTEALAAERAASVQGLEQLKKQHERDLSDQVAAGAELAIEVDRLSQLLDQQGLELHRMRHLVVQLREHLRLAREAAIEGASDAELINRALQTEVEAIGAIRTAELAELDELLSELAPFVKTAEGASPGSGSAPAALPEVALAADAAPEKGGI